MSNHIYYADCPYCGETAETPHPELKPVCEECQHKQMVKNAPDECDSNHCDNDPVAYVGDIYLCPEHAMKESQDYTTYFREFDYNPESDIDEYQQSLGNFGGGSR